MTSERTWEELSEAEKLDQIQAELAKTRTAYERMCYQQSQWERDVRVAARRNAEDDRTAWAEVYLAQLLDRAAPWLRELTHRAERLADRPKLAEVQSLRQVAGTVTHVLDTYRAELAERPDYGRKVRAEVDRLRAYITEQGRAMHAATATEDDRDVEPWGHRGTCRCAGCDLIRGMDDVSDGAQG